MATPVFVILLLVIPMGINFFTSIYKKTIIDFRESACWGLGICFIFFFVGHFVKTDGMVEMLPAWIPSRRPLVYFTGIVELFIGIFLFIPKYQLNAAKVAILILFSFFPVNVYAAINSVGLGGHQWGPIYLLIRAPLQGLLIAWAYFLCIKGKTK